VPVIAHPRQALNRLPGLGRLDQEPAPIPLTVTWTRAPQDPGGPGERGRLGDARSAGDVHPVWAYAHVPRGYDGDATEAITAQIERFAPGFRERVIGTSAETPAGFAAGNPHFAGGNILTGAKDARQLVFGVPGHFICSAATPPGPGAHGMCGAHAAARALRHLCGKPREPLTAEVTG
jgi:hypothetical protein